MSQRWLPTVSAMTTTDEELPPIRLQHRQECLGLIPAMLGFQPAESLVILVVAGGRVELTARTDLPRGPDEHQSMVTLLNRMWLRFPGADALLVAYSHDKAEAWRVLELCEQVLTAARRKSSLLVSDGWWWDDPAGPPGGTLEQASSRTAAEAVLRGLVVRGTRDELAAELAGPTASEQARLKPVLAAAEDRLAGLRPEDRMRLMAELVRGHGPAAVLGAEEGALLALLVQEPDCRDVAVLSLRRDNATQMVALWREVVATALPAHRGFVVAVLGMAAWVDGSGALLSICLDIAGELLGEVALVRILGDLMTWVVPPSTWEDSRRQMLETAPARVRRVVSPRPSRRSR